MTIGLTLSDEMLENVSHTVTALEMWQELATSTSDILSFHKLAARRDFLHCDDEGGTRRCSYTSIEYDKWPPCCSLWGVTIDDKEMAMAVLNGFPPRFGTIITALDAIGDDDPSFTFDKVRSRLLQEEKRSALRKGAENTVATSVLLTTRPGQKKWHTLW